MVLVADPKTGRHVGQAAVVLGRVNRDIFWGAVEMLKDHSRDNTQFLKPGLVGLVRYLAGSVAGLRHATVGKFWLAGNA